MKYDSQSRALKVSVTELVRIARRGIGAPQCDDAPLSAEAITRRERAALSLPGTGRELCFSVSLGDYPLTVRGYAELAEGGRVTVAATLPHRYGLADAKRELRARGFILAYALMSEEKLSEVTLTLSTVDELTRECKSDSEKITLSKASSFLAKCLTALEKFAAPEVERVTERLPSMRKLRFPYPEMREGQEELIRSAYRAVLRGSCLFASAPTGTGKTVSVLYPAVRAIGEGKCDKLFYLTPKTTTARAAAECLESFCAVGAKIRAIIISSKERCCENGQLCREDRRLCKRASGKDLPDAVLALCELNKSVITREDVLPVAREYEVCPYELELSYSELCDGVILDINYLFDPAVRLHRYFDDGGRYALLIDEAHNLPDRCREIYSASLSLSYLTSLSDNPLIGAAALIKEKLNTAKEELKSLLTPLLSDTVTKTEEGEPYAAYHSSSMPDKLYEIADRLFDGAEDEYMNALTAKDNDASKRLRLLREHLYKMRHLRDTVYTFDSSYRLFVFLEGGDISFKLFPADTGARVREAIERGRGAVFFSATLSPLDFYSSLLGGDRSSELLEVRSPFTPEQVSVSIVDRISTRYSERERTLPAIVAAIAATLAPRRGNYMVFAPSYEYCDALGRAFSAKYPKVETLIQTKDMTPAEKEKMLSRFAEEKTEDEYLVGFCTLGGIYSEGVDLRRDSLIGAVVVGVGLPQPSFEREAIAEYYDEKTDEGKLYAYVYPGMNKVLQAAGRVIRTEEDRGVVVLIDDRFADPIYKTVIPDLWRGMSYVGSSKELRERIKDFWQSVDTEH